MNRLVQGDVGCGKRSKRAFYAGLVAVAHRHQPAIMAPTELLAQQHYRSVSSHLDGSRSATDCPSGECPPQNVGR